MWADQLEFSYVVYLTLCEVMKAVVAAYFVRNAYGYCAAVWFLSQAVDEATMGNFWTYNDLFDQAEYVALAALVLTAYLFHRYHKPGW